MQPATRVLIVEDEPDIRGGVSRWLSAGGYETFLAENGEQGLQIARQEKPEVILLDVLMPLKGGMETLSELRADRKTSKIPVVMLSASLQDEQRALDAGAKYFVHKPYDGKQLVSIVASALLADDPNSEFQT